MTRNKAFMVMGGFMLSLVAAYGGWASITLEDLPDHLVAGQPASFTFTVRQHGLELLNGLNGSIEARSGELAATAATKGVGSGQYTGTLTLAEPGDWTITLRSGFGNTQLTLLPVRVIRAGTQPPVLAMAERGRRLFMAKGCVTCHTHRDVKAGHTKVGPDLTERRFEAGYLAQFLADPARVLSQRSGAKQMPNLNLKAREIAALVAFVNGGTEPTGEVGGSW